MVSGKAVLMFRRKATRDLVIHIYFYCFPIAVEKWLANRQSLDYFSRMPRRLLLSLGDTIF